MNRLTNAGYAYMEPVTLEIIKDAMLDRLGGGEGKWKESPVYYDGAAIQVCDCGQRVSLVFHSLEFADGQCGRMCMSFQRITDEAPSTWMPSGFATMPL